MLRSILDITRVFNLILHLIFSGKTIKTLDFFKINNEKQKNLLILFTFTIDNKLGVCIQKIVPVGVEQNYN